MASRQVPIARTLYAALASVVPGGDALRVDFSSGSAETAKENKPLIAVFPPRISRAGLLDIMGRVAEAAVAHCPELSEEVQKALDVLSGVPALWEGYLLDGDAKKQLKEALRELANRRGVSLEITGFLLHHTFKPFMRYYAAKALKEQEAHFRDWGRGCCPVCGRFPSLSVIRGEEGRFLYCSLCETSWRFARIGCPFCENLSAGQQEILVLADTNYRIYVCSECRGYLKTFIQQSGSQEALNPLLAEGETLHLDVIALQEGYVSRGIQL
ncbi:MAG: formate dehydrogenase accessory protein FdhE [Bacillota bacterium]